MGILTQGCEMHLTQKTRDVLNNALGVWCSHLLRIEEVLEAKNLRSRKWNRGGYLPKRIRELLNKNDARDEAEPDDDVDEAVQDAGGEQEGQARRLALSGAYTGIHGEPVVQTIVEEIDSSDMIGFATAIASLDENPRPNDFAEHCRRLINYIEAPHLIGPGIDILLDLSRIRKRRGELEKSPDLLKAFVREVAPQISAYLDRFEQHCAKDPIALGAIARSRLLLCIGLGHHANDPAKFGLHDLQIRPNVPVTFPKAVPINPDRLRSLWLSEVLLREREIISERLAAMFKASADEKAPFEQIQADAEARACLTEVVDIVCTGRVGDTSDGHRHSQETCGWSVKSEHTYSICNGGSPGCGKTMTLVAAAASIEKCGGAIGCTFETISGTDSDRMRAMSDSHRRGVLKPATREGTRNSIGLVVQGVSGPTASERLFIEIIDFPGEDWIKALEVEGSRPWVLSSLRGTNTVIIYFDLTLEPTIREELIHSQLGEQWKGVVGQAFGATKRTRGDRANVSQFRLLDQIIWDIGRFRGFEDQNLNLIVVIPKADLYARKSGEPSYFLNPVYERLESWGVLVPAEHDAARDEGDWNNYVTMAGIGATGIPGAGPNDSPVQRQLKLMEAISDATRSALLNIDAALGPDASKQTRAMLQSIVRVRLVERVESLFKSQPGGRRRVFFLPISGVGRDHSDLVLQQLQAGNGFGELDTKRPCTSKLAEYGILGPIILALSGRNVATESTKVSAPHGIGESRKPEASNGSRDGVPLTRPAKTGLFTGFR